MRHHSISRYSAVASRPAQLARVTYATEKKEPFARAWCQSPYKLHNAGVLHVAHQRVVRKAGGEHTRPRALGPSFGKLHTLRTITWQE